MIQKPGVSHELIRYMLCKEKMGNNRNLKTYNILLPIWMLIFLPTWLWLVLIPANYLIDRIVLRWSLGDTPDKGLFCRKHTWKICLAGFLSDFIGALIMFAVFMASAVSESGSSANAFLEKIAYGVGFNPFGSLAGFLAVSLSVAAAGAAIYLLDRRILIRAGLDIEQAKKSAMRLALITAPYLYYFPSEILYSSGI